MTGWEKMWRKNSIREGSQRAGRLQFAQAERDAEKNLELAAVTREFPRPFSW
jgi:hypothetical protein